MLLLVSAVASAAVTAAAAPSPALRVAALAAVTTAAAPPFSTAVEARPAARRMQDFAECPVLAKIKKDDCDSIDDHDSLPFCTDPCLCKGMHLRGYQILGALSHRRDVVAVTASFGGVEVYEGPRNIPT
jgi:hypothetical protein